MATRAIALITRIRGGLLALVMGGTTYLKSVAPSEVDIQTIFKGILPFVGLQLIGLFLILFFPEVALWPIG